MSETKDLSALAAFLLPEQWKRTLQFEGVRRLALQRELRDQAAAHYLILTAISRGGKCGNCIFFNDDHHEHNTCDLHDTQIAFDNVCPEWEELT